MRLPALIIALSIVGLGLVAVVSLRTRGGDSAPPPSLSPSRSSTHRPALSSIVLADVPHEPQKPDFCGEACVSMWLRKLGLPADQDWIFDQSGTDPQLGRGAYAVELARALGRIGFRIGAGWYAVRGGRPDTQAQLEERFAELHADLLRQIPSIVCMHFDDQPDAPEHFRLILGYDATRDEIIYHEPASASGSYQRMARAQFISLWPLKTDDSDWTVVRFRLEGRPAAVSVSAETRTGADYAQHILALKKRLPREFSIVLVPPFVVVGDDAPAEVRRHAEGTVAWTVKRLKQTYFSVDPEEIIDIWLFKDDTSYRRYTKALFDEDPETPYGYYSSEHHALFMNIATGGGTLVHEIVHPYLHANFPAAPPWLQEGLGSLYEQCDEVDGKIVGLTNWRLEGLQEQIRNGTLPTLRSLAAANNHDFYKGRHRGSGYGQARYLMFYLQQRGLLPTFYHRFHKAQRQDPTGYATLQAVLGEADMTSFQRRWERFVLGLVFRDPSAG